MKAKAGDRYRCSDASCGCEVEIRNPSRLQAEGGSTAAHSGSSGATVISGSSGRMQGGYGSDSSTGSSGSTPSSTASSRTMEDSPAGPFSQHSGSGNLSCFCGKPMLRTGQGESQSSSRAARA